MNKECFLVLWWLFFGISLSQQPGLQPILIGIYRSERITIILEGSKNSYQYRWKTRLLVAKSYTYFQVWGHKYKC